MTEIPPSAFADLPATAFPFKVEYLHPENGEVLAITEVEGPGVMNVISAKSLGVERVTVRITYGSGEVITV